MDKEKTIEFFRVYREVFNISDDIVLCGKEKCRQLIRICSELDKSEYYGNLDTGFLYLENIHRLYDKIKLTKG